MHLNFIKHLWFNNRKKNFKPVAYANHAFIPTVAHNAVNKKEALAITRVCKSFEYCLIKKNFQIMTT